MHVQLFSFPDTSQSAVTIVAASLALAPRLLMFSLRFWMPFRSAVVSFDFSGQCPRVFSIVPLEFVTMESRFAVD